MLGAFSLDDIDQTQTPAPPAPSGRFRLDEIQDAPTPPAPTQTGAFRLDEIAPEPPAPTAPQPPKPPSPLETVLRRAGIADPNAPLTREVDPGLKAIGQGLDRLIHPTDPAYQPAPPARITPDTFARIGPADNRPRLSAASAPAPPAPSFIGPTHAPGRLPPPTAVDAANQILEGLMQIGQPALAASAVVNPVELATALSLGIAAQKAAESGTEALGARPDVSRLVGNLAALGVGGKAAELPVDVLAKKLIGERAPADLVRGRAFPTDAKPAEEPAAVAAAVPPPAIEAPPAPAPTPTGAFRLDEIAPEPPAAVPLPVVPPVPEAIAALPEPPAPPAPIAAPVGASADVLPTGEIQPRLPGDVGAVRDVEVPDAKLQLPPQSFDLTAPPETTPDTGQLFRPEPAVPERQLRPETVPERLARQAREERLAPRAPEPAPVPEPTRPPEDAQHPGNILDALTQRDEPPVGGQRPRDVLEHLTNRDLETAARNPPDYPFVARYEPPPRLPARPFAKLKPALQAEVQRIADELDEFPYERRSQEPTSRAVLQDPSLDYQEKRFEAGKPGAPVYHDIQQGKSGSRRAVAGAIKKYILEGGQPSAIAQRAVEVAQRRMTGDPSLSRPTLPLASSDVGRGHAPADEATSFNFGANIGDDEVQYLHGGFGAIVPHELPKPLKAAGREILDLVNAPGASPRAQRTADLVSGAKAAIANNRMLEERISRRLTRHFEMQSKEQGIATIAEYERTGKVPNAPEGYTELLKASDQKAKAMRREAYGANAAGHVENYVRRAFTFGSPTDEAKGTTYLLGEVRRSLSANKSPNKARILDMPLDEALANMRKRGIQVEPVTTNIELLRQWSLNNARQAVEYRRMWNDAKAEGHVVELHVTEDPPEGFVPLSDRVARVFKSPMLPISEAYDLRQMEALRQVANNLGVRLERTPKIGGSRWGYQQGQRVVTKFAGPESVLAHELGHAIDDAFTLKDKIRKQVSPKELRALADLRFEGAPEGSPGLKSFQKYVRKTSEKMAVLFEAYMHAPERMKEVAPSAYRFVDKLVSDHIELQPFKKAQRGSLVLGSARDEIYAGGHVQSKQLYADPTVARVLDRAISGGMGGSPTIRGLRAISNSLNQVQLGFSGFHLVGTAINASLSDVVLGVRQAGRGDLGAATKSIGKAASLLGSFIHDISEGHTLVKGLEQQAPEALQFLTEVLNPAGGRISMDTTYRNGALQSMKTAFANGQYVRGALVHLPMAVVEGAAWPIMTFTVPRVKLGAFMDLAADMRERFPADPNEPPGNYQARLQRHYREAWDSIDNRFGQLVYDNLFWNTTAKEVMQLSFRSVGWNLGTKREIGGGLIDLAKGKVTDRGIYATVALPFYVGMLGAIYQYLHTGQGPQELKDYFYPKNGQTDASGNPERIALPTYVKDVYGYTHHPVTTFIHKASPLLASTVALIQNENYFGDLIRNPDDPAMQQAEQVGAYLVQQMQPFSVGQVRKLGEEDGVFSPKALEGFAGMIPAPAEVVKSDVQKQAESFLDQIGGTRHRTPEQVDSDARKRAARATVQAGAGDRAAVEDLVQQGDLKNSRASVKTFVERARMTPFERELQSLPIEKVNQLLTSAGLPTLRPEVTSLTSEQRVMIARKLQAASVR